MARRTPRRKRTKESTALVRVEPAQLAPPTDGGDEDRPLDRFLRSYARSEASRRTMHQRLDVAAGILEPGKNAQTFAWESLDAAKVERVLAQLRERNPTTGKPSSPATVNVTRAALIKMARVLFSMRFLTVEDRQFVEDVERDRGQRDPRGRALDAREIRKLFRAAALDATPAGRRDAALLAVLYGGGLRRDEASQLDASDYRDGVLKVRGKGDKHASAPIGPAAGAAVEAWIAARGTWAGALFVTINKGGKIGRRRLSGAAIAWTVERLHKRASIPRLTPHDLRRTFVTALLEAGEDISTASKAARHASISTTALYDRRDGKRVVAAVGKLVVPFGG